MTPKQAMFVEEYLADFNQTRAAIAVGVPEKSAAVTASRWLRKPEIARIVAERRARRAAKLDATAERLDQEILRIAYADPACYYDADGNLIPVHLLGEDARRAISMFEDETQGVKRVQRVKLCDKLRAIELAYKRQGLLTDKVEHSGNLTLEQLVCGSYDPDDDEGKGGGGAPDQGMAA